jgi:transcriptional regulator with XRE-family HTH domain
MRQLNTIVLRPVNTIVFANTSLPVKNPCMTLAERIETARLDAELSPEELADKAGCSVDLIRKLESGKRQSTTYMVKIARACKVSADWLDDETGTMKPEGEYVSDPDLVEIIRLTKPLTPTERNMAITEVERIGRLAAQIRAEYSGKKDNN